jgi:hypothetical protein
MEIMRHLKDMKAFIAAMCSPRLQERLESAISERGNFRYFKDVLPDCPAECKRWFQFEWEWLYQRICD